jgi:hypothetical protein
MVKGDEALDGSPYVNALLDHLTGFWKYKYHGIFKIKNETELNDNDIRNNHLILLGNQKTNAFIDKIINKLPVTIKENQIAFRNHKYQGNINFQFIYPNTLNPKKYIVLIGSNNMGTFRFCDMDLASNGWYDYQLWKFDSGAIEIIEQGWFDQNWQ